MGCGSSSQLAPQASSDGPPANHQTNADASKVTNLVTAKKDSPVANAGAPSKDVARLVSHVTTQNSNVEASRAQGPGDAEMKAERAGPHDDDRTDETSKLDQGYHVAPLTRLTLERHILEMERQAKLDRWLALQSPSDASARARSKEAVEAELRQLRTTATSYTYSDGLPDAAIRCWVMTGYMRPPPDGANTGEEGQEDSAMTADAEYDELAGARHALAKPSALRSDGGHGGRGGAIDGADPAGGHDVHGRGGTPRRSTVNAQRGSANDVSSPMVSYPGTPVLQAHLQSDDLFSHSPAIGRKPFADG